MFLLGGSQASLPAETVLGHSRVETTQIYAEKDVQAAMKLMAEVG